MASHDTAFRPLQPDAFHHYVNDDNQSAEATKQSIALEASPAKIVSLQAYKALRSLKQTPDAHKIHDINVLFPLINEAHLRPVRFYRGLEEWLLGQDQAHDKA